MTEKETRYYKRLVEDYYNPGIIHVEEIRVEVPVSNAVIYSTFMPEIESWQGFLARKRKKKSEGV